MQKDFRVSNPVFAYPNSRAFRCGRVILKIYLEVPFTGRDDEIKLVSPFESLLSDTLAVETLKRTPHVCLRFICLYTQG